MQTKSIINATVGGTTLIATIFTILRGVVALIGDVETTANIVTLVHGTPINWSAFWAWVACVGGVTLVINNYTDIARWKAARSRAKHRVWNTPLPQAIRYIVWGTHFGDTIRAQQPYDLAGKAIVEMALAGRLPAAGRDIGSGALRPLTKREWKKLEVEVSVTRDRVHGDTIHSARLCRLNTADEAVQSVMFNRTDLQELWPQKPERF